MRFKIDWASLIVGSKFTVFALFYCVFEGNFSSTSPWRPYIWRGELLNGGFLALPNWGGGGAYIWRGLFSEFYCIYPAFLSFLFWRFMQVHEPGEFYGYPWFNLTSWL